MRFLIGALALLVIFAVLVSPAAMLLGLVHIASDRHVIDTEMAEPAKAQLPQSPR